MYKNMGLLLVLLLTLIGSSCATVDVSENSYLIGYKVGVTHSIIQDFSTEWLQNSHMGSYWEGTIRNAWYDFVLIEYNNGEFEWISKYSIMRLVDNPTTLS